MFKLNHTSFINSIFIYYSSKGGILILYQQIFNQKQHLEEEIYSITQQLKDLPDGSLLSVLDKKYRKWYYCNNHTRTYLPKGNRDFAEQLAKKKYLQALLQDLTQEKKALDAYLAHYRSTNAAVQLATSLEYQDLLGSLFQPISQTLSAWQNDSYPTNPNHPEQLCIKGTSGKLVRSKSEAFIDMALSKSKIPFRYECALQLGNLILYPDFTIRHPRTGSFYYWEHFGLMDDPIYYQKATKKIELYCKHNIFPSVNLIITSETKDQPLSPEIVTKTIALYFQ